MNNLKERILKIPGKNVDSDQVLASWLELSAFASMNRRVTRGQVREYLRDSLQTEPPPAATDGNISSSPEDLRTQDLWDVLIKRQKSIGRVCPFKVETDTVSLNQFDFKVFPAYLTMLLIDAVGSEWYAELAHDEVTNEIRNLFEEITCASLATNLRGKSVHFPSIPVAAGKKAFPQRVDLLAQTFATESDPHEVNALSSSNQNDDGLDVVCEWRLDDDFGTNPCILVQCATGKNWRKEKRGEPPISKWSRYVRWQAPTLRAIAVPYVVRTRGELRAVMHEHENAIVIDRVRLAAGDPDSCLQATAKHKLTKWNSRLLKKLPIIE